jgi:hypothetical protein
VSVERLVGGDNLRSRRTRRATGSKSTRGARLSDSVFTGHRHTPHFRALAAGAPPITEADATVATRTRRTIRRTARVASSKPWLSQRRHVHLDERDEREDADRLLPGTRW